MPAVYGTLDAETFGTEEARQFIEQLHDSFPHLWNEERTIFLGALDD
jgi:hypothetical protein